MSKKEKNSQTTGRKTISKRQDIINRFCKNRNAVIGMIVAAIFVFIALFAPLLVDYDKSFSLFASSCCFNRCIK